MMRLLLIAAAVLFSLQFLLQQQYGKGGGQSLSATLFFAACSNTAGFALLVLTGNLPTLSLFSLSMAALYALTLIGYMYCSQKALGKGTLSTVSLFSMLGGMLLPAAAGFALGEPFSVSWVICCGLIAAAVLLSAKGQPGGSLLWYCAVFLCNGAVGVISKLHQISPLALDSADFLAWAYLLGALGCWFLYLLREKKFPRGAASHILLSAGYAGCNTIGNYLCLTALLTLPASEQYPMVTGGVIFFCGILSILQKEKITVKKLISATLAIAGTVMLIF